MSEPTRRDTAVSYLVRCQFPYHRRFRSGMRKHIDEVHHNHVQLLCTQLPELVDQLLRLCRMIQFRITKALTSSVSVELRLNQWCFIEVLALFLVFIYPQLREHRRNLVRHQSCEDGITSILGSGRKNRNIEVLIESEIICQLLTNHPPLVISQIIEHHQINLFSCVEQRENHLLKDVGAHDRTMVWVIQPVDIVLHDKLGKLLISIRLLHLQHFLHRTVGLCQLQFPKHQLLIHLHPVVQISGIIDLHTDIPEVLLITRIGLVGLNRFLVQMALERQKYLVGINRLNQIIRNLCTNRLVHDILLLTLRHHHRRHGRIHLLDALQSFQTCQTRHVLIQENQVEVPFLAQVNRVLPIRSSHHLIIFLL